MTKFLENEQNLENEGREKDANLTDLEKILQNASLLAIVAVDTEENELSKVLEFYLIFIRPRDLIFTCVHLTTAPRLEGPQHCQGVVNKSKNSS